jgi:hypothetical protein
MTILVDRKNFYNLFVQELKQWSLIMFSLSMNESAFVCFRMDEETQTATKICNDGNIFFHVEFSKIIRKDQVNFFRRNTS